MIRAIEIAQADKSKQNIIKLPKFEPLVLGIDIPRDVLKKRITDRLKLRFDQGMIAEVKGLYELGIDWEKLHFFGLEYRFIAQHLKGELTYNDMFQKLNSAIHYFAKQQMKWFRKIEKKGHVIEWLNHDSDLEAESSVIISRFLEQTPIG